MFSKFSLGTAAGLAALLFFAAPSQASVIYSYTGGTSFYGAPITISFTAAGPLTGLSAGTDISGSISGFTFNVGIPPSDNLGFPLGVNSLSSPVVQVGTDSVGNITSWNISESVFASYPAVPGEDPNDFFCTYQAAASNGGDSYTITQDHDAGLCPGTVAGVAGTWTPTFASTEPAPEPMTLSLFGAGLAIAGFSSRRARKAKQV